MLKRVKLAATNGLKGVPGWGVVEGGCMLALYFCCACENRELTRMFLTRCCILGDYSEVSSSRSPAQHPTGPPQLHPEVQQGAAEHVQEPRDLLAPLHVARLQPGQRRGGAAHPPRQLRDHQHAAHADADVRGFPFSYTALNYLKGLRLKTFQAFQG